MREIFFRLRLKKRQLLIVLFIIISFTFSPEMAVAEVTKRVVFPKGKKSVSYRGRLPREYASYDSYILRAKKGQTITVKLATTDRAASFAVYEIEKLGPDEDAILPNNPTLRTFTGELPITSEYSVQVYGVSSIDEQNPTGAAYTIEITLR